MVVRTHHQQSGLMSLVQLEVLMCFLIQTTLSSSHTTTTTRSPSATTSATSTNIPTSRMGTRLQVGSPLPPDGPSHLMTLQGTKIALVDDRRLTVLCFLRHLA
jgi:hypothetical protein